MNQSGAEDRDMSLANDQKRALWAASAPEGPALQALSQDVTADVAIIGGGFTGLSAALHLAESGKSVILLEAHQIGHGGSGRNVGLVNAGLWLMPDLVEQRLGSAKGAALNELLAGAPDLVFSLIQKHEISCEAVRNGTLHLAHSYGGRQELQQRYDQLKARGAPVTLLDAFQTEAKTGSARYLAALQDARAGTIQPLAYARGLARAALQAGASLHTDSPVRALTKEGKGWLVETDHASVTAQQVIQAGNAYGEGFPQTHRNSYVPVHYFQLASQPLDEEVRKRILPGLQGCWDTRQVMCSFRLDAQGRLILGSIGGLGLQTSGMARHWADKFCRHLFPWLGRLEWEYAWDGRIGMTSDALPRCFSRDGLVGMIAYNGRGIGPGTAFGKAMAQYVMDGDETHLPLSATDPETVLMPGLRSMAMECGIQAVQTARRVFF